MAGVAKAEGEQVSTIVGRDRERDVLARMLDEDGPLAVFVHGPAGIGKSALLADFTGAAHARGAAVVHLDCGDFEPTGPGLLDAIGRAMGRQTPDPATAASALGDLGGVAVLVVDTYERFRISDSWLRSRFLPELPGNVRLVVAGREPPLSSWLDGRGDPGRFRSVLLGPIEDHWALELLERSGMASTDARSVNRFARGHPLALQVAALALHERPGLRVEETALPRVVDELTRLYLEQLDRPTRRVLDAASVARRVTAPLLEAMLDGVPAAEALDRLAGLPFVEEGSDGLRLHEAVQAAIASRLAARDPDAHRRYRIAAWRLLRRQAAEASRSELWRHTADLLYLLENPAVREAFFPSTAHLYAIEPACPADGPALMEIIDRHEPAEAAAVLRSWWELCPATFRAVRDRAGGVAGLLVVGKAEDVPVALTRLDPVVAAWREHQSRHPLPGGQRALFDRCELSRDHGNEPCAEQAAIWLDIKRIYMEMRPSLGRLYSVTPDPRPLAEALRTLGFAWSETPVGLGRDYTPLWLDFGPRSVDGWLERLAAAELNVQPEEMLDEANRELVLDGRRVTLTALEFRVIRSLLAHRGRAVSRATLIEEAWGHAYTGGSNVVDVVVRGLRRKMGPRARDLETVRGVGYRLVG